MTFYWIAFTPLLDNYEQKEQEQVWLKFYWNTDIPDSVVDADAVEGGDGHIVVWSKEEGSEVPWVRMKKYNSDDQVTWEYKKITCLNNEWDT